MNRRRLQVFASLLAAAALMLVVWVLLVWVASRPALKRLIDLTPQSINSVDPVTEDLLRELRKQEAQVEFHLFFPPITGQPQDEAQAQWLAIRNRLRDLTGILLRRYQWLGGESVKIFAHDFYQDTQGTREAAQAFDYKAAEVETVVVAVRQKGGERRYRKLSLLADLAEIDQPSARPSPVPRVPVPVLKDFKGEQAISSALKSLLVQGKPVAYLVQGYAPTLDLYGNRATSYGGFLTGLQNQGFEIKELNLQAASGVPADAALVIALEPTKEFTDQDALALFAYLKRGGRLFVDYAFSPVDWTSRDSWNPRGGKLGELLGYQLSAQPVFHMIPDSSGRSGGRGYDGTEGVAKLQLQVNSRHPVTRRIADTGRPVEVAGARELKESGKGEDGVQREALLLTGKQGWLAVPGADGLPDLRAPQIRLDQFCVGMAFQVETEAGANAAAGASGAPTTGQAVIVSGVFANNTGLPLFGDLAYNICNWMAERRVLLDIRGARYEARQLDLKEPQLDRAFNLLVYGVPGTFLVLGFVVFAMRRRL